MENFSLVYALSRAALSGDVKDGQHQVARIKAALEKRGLLDNAEMLGRLVSAVSAPASRRSASFQQSDAEAGFDFAGEVLTSANHVPVDRETSAPLAEVLPLESLPKQMPTLPSSLTGASEAVVREWRHAKSLQRLGLEPARTCLIYGPPGTGKTQLALWLAGQLGLPVIVAKLDGLMSSYLGTTSRNIGKLFAYANKYRAILLLDEFDSIAKLRDDPNEIGEIKRVVNTLLQELDMRRAHGLTIAITNHPGLLDPAVWRRFEAQLETPMPDATGRLHILEQYLPPLQLDPGQQRLLSWALDGCSGSEIEDLVRALKKSVALDPDVAFVDRLQRLSAGHGDRLDAVVKRLLSGEREALANELMTTWNLPQSRVAEALGVNRSTINRWHNEKQMGRGTKDGGQTASSVRGKPRGPQKAASS